MITNGHTQGATDWIGRFVFVQSICDEDTRTVIIRCDGGNCTFQHNMTPDEARELAGYLLAEANYCESAMEPA